MKNEHRDPDQVDLAARRNPLWERTAAKRALASDADQIRGQRHSDSKTSRDEPERSCAAVKIPQREKCAVGENSERRASPGQCSAFARHPAGCEARGLSTGDRLADHQPQREQADHYEAHSEIRSHAPGATAQGHFNHARALAQLDMASAKR